MIGQIFLTDTMNESIYIGVAWPYAYAPFHIGNLYGSHLPADIFSRFHKLQGNHVVMVSGSDCHGTPITLQAEKEGVAPEEIADTYHKINTQLLEDLSIEYSNWTTTATANHREVVEEMFLQLLERGYIVQQVTKQLYDPKEQKFMQDRYVEGTCPYCGYEKARGDQCDGCGRLMDALKLINPRSKVSGDELEVSETENYMLDLASLQKDLEPWVNGKEGTFADWMIKETSGWFEEGLAPRAITRDMDYGIPLPVDRIPEEKQVKDIDRKVFYVWFEAVIGYLSATIEWAAQSGDTEAWTSFWKNKDAKQYYFLGQDNLVFHTINWPAQLMGTGQDYTLPENVFVTKYLMLEGQKISKSNNWIVDTRDLLDSYSLDSIRFYLSYIMSSDTQTNFQWEDFFHVNNSVFLAKIGNLVNRVLSFSVKQFGTDIAAQGGQIDTEVVARIEDSLEKVRGCYAESKVRDALLEICELCDYGNEYLTKFEFWKLVKEDKDACRNVVVSILEIIHMLPILLAPVVPDFATKLHGLLGYGGGLVTEEGRNLFQYEPFPTHQELAESIAALVPKFEETMVEEEKAKLG